MAHTFRVLPDTYSISRLGADAAVPGWATQAQGFVSITRTDDELSIVCRSDAVPDGVRADGDWRTIKIDGPFAFDQIGVLASLAAPLADAGVAIFVVSTFDTDHVLVKAHQLEQAIAALRSAGHVFAG
jgi:hypothetical protein